MRLLCLDLSTTASGYAFFENSKLIFYGCLTPESRGMSQIENPWRALKNILSISEQIQEIVIETRPDLILIEEVNRGKNRVAQKSLDALHFFVINSIWNTTIEYINSDGPQGWRTILNIRLSEEDKKYNKIIRRNIKKGLSNKAEILGWKDLSCRFANNALNLNLNVKLDPKDADEADAICIGLAYLKRELSK